MESQQKFSASVVKPPFPFISKDADETSPFLHPHFPPRKPEIIDNTNIIMYQKVAKMCVGGCGEAWGTLHFC